MNTPTHSIPPSVPWPDLSPLDPAPGGPGATVAFASVPIPAGADWRIGYANLPSQAVPIAWHPSATDQGPGEPRQVLLLGLADPPDAPLPATLSIVANPAAAARLTGSSDPRQAGPRPADQKSNALPSWELQVVSQKKTGWVMREVNELVLRHQGRTVGLRMGVRRSTGCSWWQFGQVEELWSGPICTAFRAAGYIAIQELPEDVFITAGRYNSGYWLHRHNWIYGEIYLLAFANGLIRATARHINNRFFDKGEPFDDVQLVLGLRADGAQVASAPLDNRCHDFNLGQVQLDLSRSSDLRSPEHPGRIDQSGAGDLVIVQPYTGPEITFGPGEPAEQFELKSDARRLWAGMARSFGFDLTLGDQPTRTRRYLPPWGWTVHAGVLWPDGASALPARGPMEPIVDQFATRLADSGKGGLTSGRYLQESCLWDGEHAHAFLCQAYRTRRPDYYQAALHHAYAMADTGVDHTDFSVRIWFMKQGSTSQVLHRMLGMLSVYLEEGDPYLLRVAESVADAAYATDRSNWPRRSYGRDGAYIRSLTRLYDVTGNRHHLRRAGEACRRAAQCQLPDGSFTDQGGAAEAHGHLSTIVKPWMNAILSEAMVDYLERDPGDQVVADTVLRCANWLLSVQLHDEEGAYWPYECAWGDNQTPPYAEVKPGEPPPVHPTGLVQLDYLARVLLWVSRRTGQSRYAQAWVNSYQRQYLRRQKIESSYGNVKVAENLPWFEAHLWNARWHPGTGAAGSNLPVELDPLLPLIEPRRTARIELPNGQQIQATRTDQGIELTPATPASGPAPALASVR